MIPQIIHYCWLSDEPLPKDIQRYIKTWKKHLKGYEIMKWDFNRFPKEKCPWVSEAFDCKKYAFAADYLRLYALYNYGGIYLDSDVEVLKAFDKFLGLNTMMCYENTEGANDGTIFLEVAAFGTAKGEKWVGDCLKHYDGRHFVNEKGEMDMTTLPEIVMEGILNNGYTLKDVHSVKEAQTVSPNEIPVFPYDYFSPKNLYTMKVTVTQNTHSIHNYKGSWVYQPVYHYLLGIGIKQDIALKVDEYYRLITYYFKLIKEGTFFWKLKKYVLKKFK